MRAGLTTYACIHPHIHALTDTQTHDLPIPPIPLISSISPISPHLCIFVSVRLSQSPNLSISAFLHLCIFPIFFGVSVSIRISPLLDFRVKEYLQEKAAM